MNHSIVIARRELRDRTRLFLLAVAFAVIPFLAAQMPGARNNRVDVIAMGAAILGAALGVGAAVILGNTVIGRELSDRRLSFYFSKPISPASLWVGKATAALATSIACFLIVVLPAFLLVGKSWNAGIVTATQVVVTGTVAIAVLFLVSHALSTVMRSRSALIVIDLVLAVVAAAVTYRIVWTIGRAGNPSLALLLACMLPGAFVVVLALAPLWQLAKGRTDAVRGHVAFSRFVWPAVGGVLLLAAIFTGWAVTPRISDIRQIERVERAPAGDSLLVTGPARASYASFLVDVAKWSAVRMPAGPLWWGTEFSRDGSTLAWAEPEGSLQYRNFWLHVRKLDDPEARNRDTGIRVSSWGEFALSEDGSRVAVVNDRSLAVHEVSSGKLLGSAPLGRSAVRMMFFVTPDTVRVLEGGQRRGDPLRVYELSLTTRKFTKTGDRQGMENAFVSASADGSRMLLPGGVIADGRTAATIWTLPEWNAKQIRPRMMHDGRVARTGLTADGIHVQVFGTDATLHRDIALPAIRNAAVSGDTADGKLIVVGSRERGKDHSTFVIDLESGAVVRALENARRPGWHWSNDPRQTPMRGELVSVNADGELILFNHNTGHSRKVF